MLCEMKQRMHQTVPSHLEQIAAEVLDVSMFVGMQTKLGTISVYLHVLPPICWYALVIGLIRRCLLT
jgi:hypothetical protein